jgi:hypothetical protein
MAFSVTTDPTPALAIQSGTGDQVEELRARPSTFDAKMVRRKKVNVAQNPRQRNQAFSTRRSHLIFLPYHAISSDIYGVARYWCDTGPPDPVILADTVPNRIMDRYDSYLPPDLLSLNYASGELDVSQAWDVLAEALAYPAPPATVS